MNPALFETWFPSRELSLIIAKDKRARDPVYAVHRWWARRPPALLRAILLGSTLPPSISPEQFWENFASEEHLLEGSHVYDPFAGGGSTLVEAFRLGAHVSGGDVDPMAVKILERALRPADAATVRECGAQLISDLTRDLGQYYPPVGEGTPLHYFSIARVICPHCGESGSLYRNLVLVRDIRKPGGVTRDYPLCTFCPDCFSLHEMTDASRIQLRCCGRYHRIDTGTFSGQHYDCPHCGTSSTHRELRTGVAPRKIIAVEDVIRGGYRRLRTPSDSDLAALSSATTRWKRDRDRLPTPSGAVRSDRKDERPRSYGIERYEEMFTPRQLLVLGRAFQWIRNTRLAVDVRDALELAVSNALATNNRLCGYATDYGRLSALFTVRGYSLPVLSVELNPLHPSGGRGSISACIERIARSADDDIRRYTWSPSRNKVVPRRFQFTRNGARIALVHRDAATVSLRGPKADVVVFDPPYFDYIVYDELSDFHRAWLNGAKLEGQPLLPNGVNSVKEFGARLGLCLKAILTNMTAGRPIAFTYHSQKSGAWEAVGIALDVAQLRVTALWPVRSDGHMGHHSYPGNCEWDVVVMCRPAQHTSCAPIDATVEHWVKSVHPIPVNRADRSSFRFALEMAVSRFGAPTLKEDEKG